MTYVPDDASLELSYSDLFARFGDACETVRWRSKEQQTRRFNALLKVDSLQDSRILDVGCGLGHLYDHLLSMGWRGRYYGLDCNSTLLAAARARCDVQATFVHGDAVTTSLGFTVDYALISGLFNDRRRQSWPFMTSVLLSSFAVVKHAIAFNFVVDDLSENRGHMAYYSKNSVLEFCRERLSPASRLDSLHSDGNATICVYRAVRNTDLSHGQLT